MSEKTILVWFRNDLRIHDNEILLEAVRKADSVLPVYCFDPYYFQHTASCSSKTGNFRTRFLLEAVADLRKSLQAYGAELIVRTGNPAEILPQLAEQYQVNEVYHHREVAYEETGISEQVEAALWKMRLNLKHFIGHTLYHKEDLPFPIKDIPDSFPVFKKKVERDSNVRPCVPTPEHIVTPEITDAGELPTLQQLGLNEPVDDVRATNYFQGGETAALAQLHQFFSKSEQSGKSKSSRNSHINSNSSKLSPWLAVGCISPRQVYWEIFKHMQDSSYAQNAGMLKLELLWRDYFRFMFKKHGQKFIKAKTAEDEAEVQATSELEFNRWANGETGVPYIDACMHELNATGYICNQCRQIVATYLVHDLKADWTRGAAYFEEKLIDYSPASNWGNWAFIAGINDAKESKYVIAAMQPKELETQSDFVTTWQSSPKDEAGDLIHA
ncbi:DASH family cryptochrome [Mucilaginibacter sp. SP1R1]|uniref:DASH family cryptochrome n=1 Tax=Mucilaginibacter sp. SP1R1 TaxID=2723091 RepID=UPI0016194631|nr:DASH family cryptochrome [Mucilaginibacter sp. SP1R1]MBB6147472.1 deoxyribodipyrimidine photo-lyase [Mucilaginibacter sp. SP1R1]